MSADGYEPIPDVEAPPAQQDEGPSIESLQAKYPEANGKELYVLSLLDKSIENSTPSIDIPEMKAEDLGPEVSKSDFISAFKIPSAAFALCIALPFALEGSVSAALANYLPYLFCIIIFAAAVPSMLNRFDEAFSKVELVDSMCMDKVDDVANKARDVTGQVENGVFDAIEPMKPKLDQATKVETMLKRFDPEIDIPDTSDIEKELSGSADKLADPVNQVKEIFNKNKNNHIPPYLRSHGEFRMYVVYPTMIVFLMLQILFIFAARMLIAHITLEGSTIQAYIQTDIELVLVLIATGPSTIVKILNGLLVSMKGETNSLLKERAGPVYSDILGNKMGTVKSMFLKLIHMIRKIEANLEKIPSGASLPGNIQDVLPSNIQDVIPDSIQDVIPDNIQDAIPDIPSVKVPSVKVPSVKMPSAGGFSKKKFGF